MQNNLESGSSESAPILLSDFDLSGISNEFIESAKLHVTNQPNTEGEYGLKDVGLVIPYYTAHGDPVFDDGFDFARIRLLNPREDQKYSQRKGTGVHTYLPPGILNHAPGGILYSPEGEKKGLAMASEGLAAVGLSGIDGFGSGGSLSPELEEILDELRPAEVRFVGDTDVLFNAHFAGAAIRFRSLLANHPSAPKLSVCILPMDSPGKGIDDCRGALGENFGAWFFGVVEARILVSHECTKDQLAIESLERQIACLRQLFRKDGWEMYIQSGLTKLAARLDGAIAAEKVKTIAGEFGLKPRAFNASVREQKQKLRGEQSDLDPELSTIDLSAQTASWVAEVLRSVSEHTFVVADDVLAELVDGNSLSPLSAPGLTSLADDPKFRQFVATDRFGEPRRVPFEEKHARIALDSVRRNIEFLRPVRTLSSLPLMVSKKGSLCELISGYDRDSGILVTGKSGYDWSAPYPNFGDLIGLLEDFDFAERGSMHRAISMLFTPALTRGGFIEQDRSPVFAITKDEVGAGASFLSRMLPALYGSPPVSIVPSSDRQLQEAVSDNLIRGNDILTLDNVRGDVLSQCPTLESLITEPNFNARCLYKQKQIDVRKLVLTITSNGMKLSPDLADRIVQIDLRKRPPSYDFRRFDEGSLISHVAAKREEYLHSIYGMISKWVGAGRPHGTKTGLRFPQWEGAASWILENFLSEFSFPLYPAGCSSRTRSVAKLTTPHFDFIEMTSRTVCATGPSRSDLAVSQIAELLGDSILGLDPDPTKGARKLGMILGNAADEEKWTVSGEGFEVMKVIKSSPATNNQRRAHYRFRVAPGG